MNVLGTTLGILLALLIVGITLYLLTARRYQSSDSVANSYDDWTNDVRSNWRQQDWLRAR